MLAVYVHLNLQETNLRTGSTNWGIKESNRSAYPNSTANTFHFARCDFSLCKTKRSIRRNIGPRWHAYNHSGRLVRWRIAMSKRESDFVMFICKWRSAGCVHKIMICSLAFMIQYPTLFNIYNILSAWLTKIQLISTLFLHGDIQPEKNVSQLL